MRGLLGLLCLLALGANALADVPESLSRADISNGIAKVSGAVNACGARTSAKGTVKVSVKVTGDGAVASVVVKESPDPGLGACVVARVKKATFARTKTGAAFTYPFKF